MSRKSIGFESCCKNCKCRKNANIEIVFSSIIPEKYRQKGDYSEKGIEFSSIRFYNKQIERQLQDGDHIELIRIVNQTDRQGKS